MGLSPIELAELIKPCYTPKPRLRSLICHDCLAPATMWYGNYGSISGDPDDPVVVAGHCAEHPSSMLDANKDGLLKLPDHVRESMDYCLEKLEY